jgi:Tfp pilus assembly protein PilW
VNPGLNRRSSRGFGLLDLLVGMALGLVVLGAITAAVGAGGRLLRNSSARGEGEDTTQMAVEALTFDVRRAGYDPRVTGVMPLTEAAADHFALAADLDADGVVDPNSEETTTYTCRGGRLSRIIGRQSLPLADGITRCAFQYLDEHGAALSLPAAGLDAPARTRVRAVAFDVTLLPSGLAGASRRIVVVALRRTA